MERIENKIEKRNNKKNVQKKVLMVAGLALLLGFVGYTGGTTYAKYVTSQETGSQTATVAKWGYTVSASADALLGAEYVDDSNLVEANNISVKKIVGNEANTLTVKASSDGNRIAPGTTGSFNFSVKGNAEVLSELTVTSSISDIYYEDYHPLYWTISDVADGGSKINTVAVALPNGGADSKIQSSELVTWLNDLTQRVAPNVAVDLSYVISWHWDFTTNPSNDTLDTKLGDLAAAGSIPAGVNASYSFAFNLAISVAQLAEQDPNA